MLNAQSLLSLGLTAYEAAAYLALLARSRQTPVEIAARAKIPRQRVYDVLDALAAKGLCVDFGANPKTYSAIDPRVGLEALACDVAERLEQQKKASLELAGRLAGELALLFSAGRSHNDPLAYIEVLVGVARIANRAVALAGEATRSVNSCIKAPLILSEQQNDAFMQVPLSKGLSYRSLCDRQTLRDDATRRWLERYCEQGMALRIVEALPLKMQSFDDEVVLVSMQDPAGGAPSFTAVAIRNRGAVAMLNLAFEHLWSQAQPFGE